MIKLLCLTLASASLVHCDLPARPADADEFPFQVSVKDLRLNVSLCSGVLITPDVVLSPANCLKSSDAFKVSAGSVFASKQNETRTFTNVTFSPAQNGTANNIAIIKVSAKFPATQFIGSAKVPVSGTPLIEKGKLSGWITVDPDDSRKVFDDYRLWKKCKDRFNTSKDQSPDTFCGEHTLGLQDGSLVSRNGIVYGLLVSTCPSAEMQEFVEVSMHANWLKETLRGHNVSWYGQGPNRASLASGFCLGISLLAMLVWNIKLFISYAGVFFRVMSS